MDIELKLRTLLNRNDQNISQEPKFWSFYQGWYQTGLLDTTNDRIYIFTIESNTSSKLLSATLDLQNVTKQCAEQGIESKESIIQIWESIKDSVLHTTLNSFEISDMQIKISLSINKMMKVFFNTQYVELRDRTVVYSILGSLVKYVIFITNLCFIERRELLKTIEEKDNTIDYLAFLVKDLGGKEILDKRLPFGSMLNSTIGKFNGDVFRNQLFNGIPTDIPANIEPSDVFNFGKRYINRSGCARNDSTVIAFEPETKNRSQSINFISSTKSQTSQKDIMRYGSIGYNNKRMSTTEDDNENSQDLSSANSPSPSISPKKRKFGKISTNTKK